VGNSITLADLAVWESISVSQFSIPNNMPELKKWHANCQKQPIFKMPLPFLAATVPVKIQKVAPETGKKIAASNPEKVDQVVYDPNNPPVAAFLVKSAVKSQCIFRPGYQDGSCRLFLGDGKIINGSFGIARYLIKTSDNKVLQNFNDVVASCTIDNIIETAIMLKRNSNSCQELEESLKSSKSTFFFGKTITLADIAVWEAIKISEKVNSKFLIPDTCPLLKQWYLNCQKQALFQVPFADVPQSTKEGKKEQTQPLHIEVQHQTQGSFTGEKAAYIQRVVADFAISKETAIQLWEKFTSALPKKEEGKGNKGDLGQRQENILKDVQLLETRLKNLEIQLS